jgi:hypothetical protein
MLLFAIPRVRHSRHGLFLGPHLTVMGFVVNRLNVSVTGMLGASRAKYFPSWMELAITSAMVAAGVAGFAFAVKHLKVCGHGKASAQEAEALPGARVPATIITGRGLATPRSHFRPRTWRPWCKE